LKIPRDIQDAKMLAKVLDRYKDMYYFEVMFGVVVAYVLYPFYQMEIPIPKIENQSQRYQSTKNYRLDKPYRVLLSGGDLDPITKKADPAPQNYSRSVVQSCVCVFYLN